jgi:glycosyltransferase involved in cell wall biosynthesis
MFNHPSQLHLSIVLVSYNMSRELPRTMYTLSPKNQLDVDRIDYEVVLIDNGSQERIDTEHLREINPKVRFLRHNAPSSSPVDAIMAGMAEARGEVVCACIDAARMASPRLLAAGLEAVRLRERAVVGTVAFHLGSYPQHVSVRGGYNQRLEDALLKTVDWENDGYTLFDIASFDPSSRFGLLSCPAESNALFMTRAMWVESGGFERRFRSRGGGLANLDLWKRLCDDPKNDVILLLGEGTFHQFHGGAATNARRSPWKDFDREYKELRGYSFSRPKVLPVVYGKMEKHCRAFYLRRGIEAEREQTLFRKIIGRSLYLLTPKTLFVDRPRPSAVGQQ